MIFLDDFRKGSLFLYLFLHLQMDSLIPFLYQHQSWIIAFVFGAISGVVYYLLHKNTDVEKTEEKSQNTSRAIFAGFLVFAVSVVSAYLSPQTGITSVNDIPVITGVIPPF